MVKLEYPLKDVSDLCDEVPWNQYAYAKKFTFACEAEPDIENEKLNIIEPNPDILDNPCVYAMVVKKTIFRFGGSVNGVRGKISSINTGKKIYRGRNSRLNYWILQSLLNIDLMITFYAHELPLQPAVYFGNKVVEERPNPVPFRSWLIKDFVISHGRRPIGNL